MINFEYYFASMHSLRLFVSRVFFWILFLLVSIPFISFSQATKAVGGTSQLNAQDESGPRSSPPPVVKVAEPGQLSKEYTNALRLILKLDESQYEKMLLVNRALIDRIDVLIHDSKDYSSFKHDLVLADRERLVKYKGILTLAQIKNYEQDSTLTGLVKALPKTSTPENTAIRMTEPSKPKAPPQPKDTTLPVRRKNGKS